LEGEESKDERDNSLCEKRGGWGVSWSVVEKEGKEEASFERTRLIFPFFHPNHQHTSIREEEIHPSKRIHSLPRMSPPPPPPNPLASLSSLLESNTPHLQSLHHLIALPEEQLALDLHRIEDAVRAEMEAIISERTAEVEGWRTKVEGMRKGEEEGRKETSTTKEREATKPRADPSPFWYTFQTPI